MNNHHVTIAIPTFNRAQLLSNALNSALAQDHPNLDIVVLDNASTDKTASVVKTVGDDRVRHVRHRENTGLVRNFNYAIEHNASEYLVILQDDDILEPSFVSRSLAAFEQHPSAALSFSDTTNIDVAGQPLPATADPFDFDGGLIDGHHYLRRVVAGENLVINVSNVVMRASALADVGAFDAPHSTITINSNLYFRLAARFDFVHVSEPLVQIRKHAGADHLQRETDTAPLAMLAERGDAAIHLLGSDFGADEANRKWLTERMAHLSMRRSETTAALVPDLTLAHNDRRAMALEELAAISKPGDIIVLADNDEFDSRPLADRQVLPFLEHDGYYWGPPENSEAAIAELQRMRNQGATFFCFAWPTFWWYDYYHGFRDVLRRDFPCVLANSRVIVFELTNSRFGAELP